MLVSFYVWNFLLSRLVFLPPFFTFYFLFLCLHLRMCAFCFCPRGIMLNNDVFDLNGLGSI